MDSMNEGGIDLIGPVDWHCLTHSRAWPALEEIFARDSSLIERFALEWVRDSNKYIYSKEHCQMVTRREIRANIRLNMVLYSAAAEGKGYTRVPEAFRIIQSRI